MIYIIDIVYLNNNNNNNNKHDVDNAQLTGCVMMTGSSKAGAPFVIAMWSWGVAPVEIFVAMKAAVNLSKGMKKEKVILCTATSTATKMLREFAWVLHVAGVSRSLYG